MARMSDERLREIMRNWGSGPEQWQAEFDELLAEVRRAREEAATARQDERRKVEGELEPIVREELRLRHSRAGEIATARRQALEEALAIAQRETRARLQSARNGASVGKTQKEMRQTAAAEASSEIAAGIRALMDAPQELPEPPPIAHQIAELVLQAHPELTCADAEARAAAALDVAGAALADHRAQSMPCSWWLQAERHDDAAEDAQPRPDRHVPVPRQPRTRRR